MSGDATTEHGPYFAFLGELKRWRDVRGVSQSALAQKVGYTPSYVSKVEGGQQKPSAGFAEQADTILRAGGALRRTFHECRRNERGQVLTPSHLVPEQSAGEPQPSSVVVQHDDAALHYDGRQYRATQRRRLRNASQDPIARYLIRVSVDRYPGNPERSNQHYRENPLTWEEIALSASLDGEPLQWKVKHDRDAFKEIWLLFENDDGRFPLYPGDSAWLEYSYTVSDEKWGTWFQRAVRLPTERLSVRLDFPADLDPVVWGIETTMTAEAFPFRTAIQQDSVDDRRVFAWSTDQPPLHARYRLEWKFRSRSVDDANGESMTATASETMRSLGIVQEGDPILTATARPFDLPTEADDARRVVAQLTSAMERVGEAHVFGKGMGIAAPQIGIDRAAALVRTPAGETITLLNPRVVEESPQTDEQYEGCLSFFDVRGMVPRSLSIEVEHQHVDGERHITIFDRGIARLIAHEIDHLQGRLYTGRMRLGVAPIPVTEYRGTGKDWKYSNN